LPFFGSYRHLSEYESMEAARPMRDCLYQLYALRKMNAEFQARVLNDATEGMARRGIELKISTKRN
jgi:hypothetical protein